MRTVIRAGAAGLALLAGVATLAGCRSANQSIGFTDSGVPAGSFQLVAFDSCGQAMAGLRAAAKAVVGPYGFTTFGYAKDMGDGALPPAPAAGEGRSDTGSGPPAATPNYSGTNTHEAGVDEPDLVKTDGRRIVTVAGGVLRVVDPVTRRVSGFLDLTDTASNNDPWRYAPADLLLSGDRALVLLREQYYALRGPGIEGDVPVAPPVAPAGGTAAGAAGAAPAAVPTELPVVGPVLILVSLTGQPRVLSKVHIDGGLLDARQVGSIARVVIRSNPRIEFPVQPQGTDAQRTKANQAVIEKAPLEQWMPRIDVTTSGRTSRSQVGCEAISRPSTYSGTSLLTILTFDLARPTLGGLGLGNGDPTTLVADGDLVYSNGPSLYVASDQRWRAVPVNGVVPQNIQARSEIYKFDTSSAGRPAFVAGGSVPGYLISQYAMSEFEGNLRVATTTEQVWAPAPAAVPARPSQSSVYVLSQDRRALRQIGHVDGLGKGERIYAVRFTGPIGYVVTFRQVDPLYTLDLSDPRQPRVKGELKINGYSAYLHPIDATRLIGVGQDATGDGRITGTQVSLFNVGDLTAPTRMARYTLSGANSEAEFDPHAFLYHEGLLVIPLQVYNAVADPGVPKEPDQPPGGTGSGTTGSGSVAPVKVAPTLGALLLRVDSSGITELGFVSHPAQPGGGGYSWQIRRSLVIEGTLWTVSDGGLLATDISSLTNLAWVSYS